MKDLLEQLPPMLTGEALKEALTVLPEYHPSIMQEEAGIRLTALSDLYQMYLPSQMSVEIYSKIAIALRHSLKKKQCGRMANRQRNENYRGMAGGNFNGIIGGSDSFTIIGESGIGKSSAISNAVSVASGNRILETDTPYTRIIPCVTVQCPHDCSVKGILLETLRLVDEALGSSYYEQAIRARATTDMLIGSVSQAALNHVGLLVVDEIQNVCGNRNGAELVAMLTQLINNSGISICMVGTPESVTFFEQRVQLARRALGLFYPPLAFDGYFTEFARRVFSYQYVRNPSEITEPILLWLFEHSAGLPSLVVSLIHDAQEIAIISGKETLGLETLNEAYRSRIQMLQRYIHPSIRAGSQTTAKKRKNRLDVQNKNTEAQPQGTDLYQLAMQAKGTKENPVELLRKYVTIQEVGI